MSLEKNQTNTTQRSITNTNAHIFKNRAMNKGNSWVRGKCIGKGAFGVVNMAYSKSDSRVFAVKSVDTKTALPNQLQALENEIEILKRLSSSSFSAHVISYLGDDVTCEGEGTSSFKNLHLEYMPGGTVADLDRADVDERLLRTFSWCLVNALRDVHARGVVHCDVKGKNVLVAGGSGSGSVVKLADFGSAVVFSGGECFSPRGSPLWMAPEVIRREYQGPESDVWSLGCTVIEIFSGKSPWEDHGFDTLSRIGFSDEVPEFPNGLSELGMDFLEKCLRRDRSRRWSCDQLLQHPFLLPCSTVVESSPRSVLDWVDSQFTESESELEELEFELNNDTKLVKNRISKLDTGLRVNWETEDWVVVRAISSEEESSTTEKEECREEVSGAILEIENVVRVGEEMEVETEASLEYSDCDERVKREMWRLLWWRECCNQCKYNRNRENSIIGGSGSCCGWRCRYRYGWEKFNRNINRIFIIYTFCCNQIVLFVINILFFLVENVIELFGFEIEIQVKNY